MEKLFGTDGIRGIANQPPLTVEMLTRIARGATYALGARKIVVGKDTRLSSYMIESALTAGFCSMGADVFLVGPMPTPGIAYLTSSMRADAGVVISASHNPYHDNGLKFFSRDGFKLSKEMEKTIGGFVFGSEIDDHLPTDDHIGKVHRIKEAQGRYVVFAKNSFPRELSLEGVKIVLDCAHGAGYFMAPLVLHELGAQVIVMNDQPDGTNINDNCGAVHPEGMCRRVLQESADLGMALDGDADRAIFCDQRGELVDGDHVLAAVALHMKSKGLLAKDTVVGTVMTNQGFRVAMKDNNIRFLETPVGDRFIVEALRKEQCNLGGEQSGHIVFLDHNTTGDGLITALQLLAVMTERQKPLSELSKAMRAYPQALVNVKVSEKKPWAELPAVQTAIAAVESKLGDRGRILVRYSGTEPLARVMVEGEEQAVIEGYAQEVAAVITKEVGVRG